MSFRALNSVNVAITKPPIESLLTSLGKKELAESWKLHQNMTNMSKEAKAIKYDPKTQLYDTKNSFVDTYVI